MRVEEVEAAGAWGAASREAVEKLSQLHLCEERGADAVCFRGSLVGVVVRRDGLWVPQHEESRGHDATQVKYWW